MLYNINRFSWCAYTDVTYPNEGLKISLVMCPEGKHGHLSDNALCINYCDMFHIQLMSCE